MEGYIEGRDEEVERAMAKYAKSVKPYLILQGAGVILGVLSVLGFLFWP